MDSRVLRFVVAVELLTSLVLYAFAPTESVRVWYPSGWAYVGEHGLVWVGVFGALFWTMRKALRMRSDVLTVLTGAAAELITTAYVWFVIPYSGEVSRAWFTEKFPDYFTARITIWGVLSFLAAILYLVLCFFRHWRVE